MSTDVAMYDEELRSLEDDIAACLRACDTLSGDARMEKLNKAADLVKKIGKVYHQYKYELRMLEGSEQTIYEKKAQEHQSAIQKLKSQLTAKRAEAPTAGAGGGAGGAGGAAGGFERKNDGKDEARASTQRIAKTQDNTIESLKRTANLVDESENIGNEAATTLKKQGDQMRENLEKLDVIEGQVDKAKAELNAFIRRMMTDKIILCFAVLIVIAIIVVVVLKITGGKDDNTNAGTPAPTTVAPTPTPAPKKTLAAHFVEKFVYYKA